MTLPSSPTKIETVATIPGPTPAGGSRRRFLHQAGALAAGATFMPAVLAQAKSIVVTC